ncbi:hypothetical protein A0H81_13524 [Grifola frondosa]|uniref:Uncharacterized protein n=1 Tax=Grifola frondosa TaxID=5627 RepID=A0A1C7LNR6_GRIFR|nr:hypothetical protein A0H81_13524 [Grifola frondosa]
MTPHHLHSHTAGSAICSDDQGCNDDLAQAKRGLHSRQTSLEVHVEVPGTHVEHRPSAISLPAHVAAESISSPITPNYQFGHDEHYETHHASAHTANLHDHSHVHDHAHEGHSDNMRGVFLHVMACDPTRNRHGKSASLRPVEAGDNYPRSAAREQQLILVVELPAIEGLESYTAPRFWPKDASSVIGTIHVQLSPSSSSFDPTGPHSTERRAFANVDTVVERVDKVLRKRIPGLDELTIQVEESNIFRE